MKKVSFIAVFAGIMASLPISADAAYPVFNPQQLQKQGYVVNTQYMTQPAPVITGQSTNITSQQLAAASVSNGRPMAATNPNRVTGALPRVGSSATNAGRQYYQSSDYDRLAESGLYLGFSAAYSTMIKGQMSADYASDPYGYLAPGSFRASDIQSDTVIPFQVSVGAAINSDIRVDFSFLRYTGMSYASNVQTSTGDGDFADASVSGGAITSNSTMLNVYYNIDSFTGYMAGGALRPYIGAGIGLSLNTIADYVAFDPGPYDDVDVNGNPVKVFDIEAYHNGGTMEQLAFGFEAGVTTDMKDGLKLDFFVRYANLGKVKTSGSVVIAQAEMDEAGEIYDSTMHYINWFESGRLNTMDVGARVRLEF